MSTIVWTTTTTDSAGVSWGAVSVFAVIAVVTLLNDWRFRTGWEMTTGRLGPRTPGLRPVYLRLSYAALPAAVASVGMVGILLFGPFAADAGGALRVVCSLVALASVVDIFVAGAWTIKEYWRPSKRRTPAWLQTSAGRRWAAGAPDGRGHPRARS